MHSKNLIWIVGLFTATCVTGKKINIVKMNITHGAFIPFANKKLNGTILLIEPAETMSQCVQKCEDHKNCQSANFKTKQCELLSDNKHESKEKFETLSGSIHLAKMSRGCDKKNCHNNATCVPDYENNTFSCNCKPEYTGKLCEVMLQSPIPDWWFKFDGGTENDGLKPNDASIIPVSNNVNEAFFYGQPHRKGKYMECNFKCTTSTISWPGWSDPEQNDIAIALWIQFPPAHLLHKKDYKDSFIIIYTKGKGAAMYYSKLKGGWAFEIFLEDGFYHAWIPLSVEETKKWTFLAMSWRHGKLSGFVNDVEVIQTHKGKWTAKQAQNVQLFYPIQQSIYNVDEFRVWYHAKSPEFMKELYYKEKVDMWH